eukprot:CAMPEP_0202011116 /NCGR_PEP_ID=MMETSP0905-20130828/18557_1 /ASSEMBLY_ACC=CAM_ASM_000554 /TAXON_ID=420261 /ORGANISM="Thalassiosira antarctica, Strain CCMP982" /LENGTH=69 /DNA_ID=CAMNT_0048569843 /DNA_START=5 /DNA_END=211 /DNA_ORIENTATION=-
MSRRTADDDNSSTMSGSGLPLLVVDANADGNDDENISRPARKIRTSFLQMSALFAINHGCTVSCLGLAN